MEVLDGTYYLKGWKKFAKQVQSLKESNFML
jgi:hypothetical protein